MSEKLAIGDLVQVNDPGLAMLRKLFGPNATPNHHGRVAEIWVDGTILVEFPIDGGYEHSQVVPYPPGMVQARGEADE